MANEYLPRRKAPAATLPAAQETPVDPMAPRVIKAPQAPAPKMTPFDAGVLQAKTTAEFQRGVESATPAMPRPQLPDTARFGVMKRNGTDPKTGREYGFVGVGANGQGNASFDSYEKAREFSQTQRAKPQTVTPAIPATATTPAVPEVRSGPAPTSLPYVPPMPNQQRGFSQDGSRDVIAPPPAPAAPVQPQYIAPAPANPVVVQAQPPAPAPTVPVAPSPATVVNTTPAPAATPVNAAPSRPRSAADDLANDPLVKGAKYLGEALGFTQSEKDRQIMAKIRKEAAAKRAQEAVAKRRANGINVTPARKPALPAVNDAAPSPLRQVADVGLPPLNPIGKNRPRASLVA